jgi:hypothetical protein
MRGATSPCSCGVRCTRIGTQGQRDQSRIFNVTRGHCSRASKREPSFHPLRSRKCAVIALGWIAAASQSREESKRDEWQKLQQHLREVSTPALVDVERRTHFRMRNFGDRQKYPFVDSMLMASLAKITQQHCK